MLFVEGLQSNLQLEIRKFGPFTYEEAKTIARNVEAAVCSRKATAGISVISSPKSEPSANIEEKLAALQSEFDLLNKSLTEIKSTLKYNSEKCTCKRNHRAKFSSRISARRPVCFNCRSPGHIARKCPLKSRTVQHNKPHMQAGNACVDSPSPFSSNINYSIGSDMNEEPTISTISTAEIDTNPCSVFGSIYSVPFNFLVDSGSHVTAVSLETCIKIFHSIPAVDSVEIPVLQTASGIPLIIKGTFECSFQIGDQFYPMKTLIIENLTHPVVLGRDFMFAYVLSIDFKKSLITLSDKPDLMTPPTEDDISDTTAFHGLSLVAEPFVSNTRPKQPRSQDASDPFDLSDTFLSDSEPFLEASVSTILDAKPSTVLSVPSNNETARNYHNARFPCLKRLPNFSSFLLILLFLTVFPLLIPSSPYSQTSPNSNPVYFTSFRSHLPWFNNSQSCLLNDSHLLNFVSQNTNSDPAHSNNLQQNSQTIQCFPVQPLRS